jgi:hypothetical protein
VTHDTSEGRADAGECPARSIRERLRPGDLLMVAVLAVACAMAALRLPGHPEVRPALVRHAALLAGLSALLAVAAVGRLPWSSPARVIASLGVMFSCYESLGRLGFLLHDRSADAVLAGLDARLLGFDPSLWLDGRAGRGVVELASFVYLFFIGWVYVSLALECLGREEGDREAFLLGLTLTYGLGYLGYLLVPAQGPAGWHAADYAHPLPGGPVYALMRRAVDSNGGAIGAFPSLHVGGAIYLCLFGLSRNRMRGLTYLPVVPLVALSTAVLRWHYVVDWIGGAAVALLSLAVTPAILARWQGAPGGAARGARAVGEAS